jgi:hypothetical protein
MFNLLKKVTNKSTQEQSVESESIALQAGNDINLQIGTLSPSDVNEICQISSITVAYPFSKKNDQKKIDSKDSTGNTHVRLSTFGYLNKYVVSHFIIWFKSP